MRKLGFIDPNSKEDAHGQIEDEFFYDVGEHLGYLQAFDQLDQLGLNVLKKNYPYVMWIYPNKIWVISSFSESTVCFINIHTPSKLRN